MTARTASRITGLEIRRIESESRYAYAAFREPDVLVSSASGGTPGEALHRLVEDLYRAVSYQVFTEQKWRCGYCFTIKPLQIHHLLPRSKGRCDLRHNLIGCCQDCHHRITNGAKMAPSARIAGIMAEHGWKWNGLQWEAVAV